MGIPSLSAQYFLRESFACISYFSESHSILKVVSNLETGMAQ
ncbi:hypothetical protein HMPREF1985_02162 [Mitsuokella sp. oral taxon 131 str. W9106]|nr:hypothetical protein HMPREF1985_02162 [Mitsuokella sp. oral taxon 131 str. W9106]